MKEFDIRDRQDILDMINAVLSRQGIIELKIERGSVPTAVEIKRKRVIPPSN
jgi:hypothetical protein